MEINILSPEFLEINILSLEFPATKFTSWRSIYCPRNSGILGLLKPSALKPILFTAEKTIIAKSLGRLKPADQEALRKVLSTVLG